MNHYGDLRFAFEQTEPRLGQVLDRRTISRANDRITRHNIHAFGDILRPHGAKTQLRKCSKRAYQGIVALPHNPKSGAVAASVLVRFSSDLSSTRNKEKADEQGD